MIAKCQRSLETTEPEVQLLIYNRTKEWLWQGPITPEWNDLFGRMVSDQNNRFFAEVRWNTSRFEPPSFVRRLPEQGW